MGYHEKLRKLCAANKLTQQELAARVGLNKNTINRIMKGQQEPKLSEAYELAKTLNVTLDFLASDQADPVTGVRLMEVTDDEHFLLRAAKILGINEAMRRVLHPSAVPAEVAAPVSAPLLNPPGSGSSPNEGSGSSRRSR